MKTLALHEEFEMRVLDDMRKIRILDQLIFGGGTMLRLCFDLARYSIDLDFYLIKDTKNFLPWSKKLTGMFHRMGAEITDEWEKHYSFLWEIRLSPYPRRLKIEVRKSADQSQKSEINIAHSTFSPLQVRLRTLTLQQMWMNKAHALSDRKEIRDAYDLEFLTRRGAGDFRTFDGSFIEKLSEALGSFSEQDFKSKLGGVLDEEERQLVLSNRFGYLKSKIMALK